MEGGDCKTTDAEAHAKARSREGGQGGLNYAWGGGGTITADFADGPGWGPGKGIGVGFTRSGARAEVGEFEGGCSGGVVEDGLFFFLPSSQALDLPYLGPVHENAHNMLWRRRRVAGAEGGVCSFYSLPPTASAVLSGNRY